MNSVQNQKQGFSIYTVLLLLSMIFMLIAVIAMYVELKRYQPDYWEVTSGRIGGMIVMNLPLTSN
ncbi:hypothetical protein SH139x_004438 [Planctomycetaceae bacterium SH139]